MSGKAAKPPKDQPGEVLTIKIQRTMYTYFIFYEKQLRKVLTNQETDRDAFGWLQRNQSNSNHRALTIEGWKIEVKNQDTGLVHDYLTQEPIKEPLCADVKLLSPWNATVMLRDTTEDETVKETAAMLLRQRNTAGGAAMEGELISFLHANGIVNITG
jgi:hypothetical protein